MAIPKASVKTGGYFAKGTFGRGGIKWRYIDQVNFSCAKNLGAAKYLGNIKACLEMIQYQNEIMHPGRSRLVAPLFLLVSEDGIFTTITTVFAFLAADHLRF